MTILDLKDQIVHNTMSNFYVFVGDEIGIINIYLAEMSNKLNLPITRIDSVANAYGMCQVGTLFGNSRGFYVIRDDRDFMKADKYFDSVKLDIGNNTIVLLYDKIDSRLKFGKHFKDDTVVFEKLAPGVIKSYIKREVELSARSCDTLVGLCNCSYDLCMLEVDKVIHFMECTGLSADMAFNELLSTGVIYQPEEFDVWKFVTAVCNRDIKSAFYIEDTLRKANTSTVSLLGTLYNSLKTVLLIQVCESPNVSEVTGLDSKVIYANKKYLGRYNVSELILGVKIIAQVVDDIKVGKIDDCYATRYVLSRLM